ncbi:MAG: acyl-CoA dehydrogenase family protein [Polyangiaceae bacterium]
MDHAKAVEAARTLAREVLAPNAHDNDKNAAFPEAAVKALGAAGLLGLTVPVAMGGHGLGPRTYAEVVATLAEADASLAMIYKMHVCGVACLVSFADKSSDARAAIADVVKGKHLSTLAFSEQGSRSHFWAPVSKATKSGAKYTINAQKSWVTSAGHADSAIVSAQLPDAKAPTESGLFILAKGNPGARVSGKWDALGMRANGSAPMTLESCEISETAMLTREGFKAMLEIVLPWFNLGQASSGSASAAPPPPPRWHSRPRASSTWAPPWARRCRASAPTSTMQISRRPRRAAPTCARTARNARRSLCCACSSAKPPPAVGDHGHQLAMRTAAPRSPSTRRSALLPPRRAGQRDGASATSSIHRQGRARDPALLTGRV